MTETIIVRRSWVTYVRPGVRLAVMIAAAVAYLAFRGEVMLFLRDAAPTVQPVVHGAIAALPLLIFIVGACRAIWRILLNSSFILRIGKDGVDCREGILPWKKTEYYWRYNQIFGANYANRPEFLGWLLRCGDVTIVGREGSTRNYCIWGVHDPRRVQVLISGRAEG